MVWWIGGLLYVFGLGLLLAFFNGVAILNEKAESFEYHSLVGKCGFAAPSPYLTSLTGTIVRRN